MPNNRYHINDQLPVFKDKRTRRRVVERVDWGYVPKPKKSIISSTHSGDLSYMNEFWKLTLMRAGEDESYVKRDQTFKIRANLINLLLTLERLLRLGFRIDVQSKEANPEIWFEYRIMLMKKLVYKSTDRFGGLIPLYQDAIFQIALWFKKTDKRLPLDTPAARSEWFSKK